MLDSSIDALGQPTVKRLPDALAGLITTVSQAEFWAVFAGAAPALCDHDCCVVFRYTRDGAPALLYNNFEGTLARTQFADYRDGAYRLDPFYEAFQTTDLAGVARLRDLAADRFYRSRYYRSYYSQTGMCDEVGLCVPTPDRAMVAAFLCRKTSRRRFSVADCRQLVTWEPALQALILRHLETVGGATAPPAGGAVAHHHQRLLRHAERALTGRELEVADLILRGHSSPSMALNLDISVETVRVHRRNLYAKLGVSSQAELFALAMNTASQVSPERGA